MKMKNSLAKMLMDVIIYNAQELPKKQAVSDNKKNYCYADFFNEIKKIGLRIEQLGLQEGSIAIIQLPNRTITLVLLIALLNKGIKPLFAAPTLRIKEITALREKTGAGYYFFPEKYGDIDYSSLAEELTNTTCCDFHTFKIGEESILPSFYNQSKKNLVTNSPYIAFLTSSGSTGLPKVIPLTDEVFIQRCTKWKNYCAIDRDTRFLAYLSIMYPMTLHSPGVLTTLLCGGSVFLADRAETEIQSFLSMFARHGITHSALVPSFAAEFVRLAGEKSLNFETLKVLEIGGEPLSNALAEKIRVRFNCLLFEVYGMTEGFSFTTVRSDITLPADELHFEYRIVDATSETSSNSDSCGELQVRGSEIFAGYYNEDNKKYFTEDNWFITGDIVDIDRHGQVVSAKRKSNVINKFGTKISCHEVEALLEEIETIETAAVVPFSCEEAGQKICAFVTGKSTDTKKLREAFMKLGVAEIKFPDKFLFLKSLPLNSRLKVDRLQLLELIEQERKHQPGFG